MASRSELPAELTPLWREVHKRLSSGRPVGRVRVGPLDDEQRSAIADLLGTPRLPGEYVTMSMKTLDEILREAVGSTVHEIVTDLIGPVGDRAEERRRAAADRDELWSWLDQHPVVIAQPALAVWTAAARRAKLVDGSVARTQAELERALCVLAELPATGVPLPVFADQVLRDSHALDDGSLSAGLILRALMAIYDVDAPADAPGRRALWERAGVTDDQLSSAVLAAGLQLTGDGVVPRILDACAGAGQAAALTLGQLRRSRWRTAPDHVWVFENPSVLALALDRFGAACPPIVVTSGWPSSAGILLLQRLAAAGTHLLYHGDFDGEGLRIAAHLAARTGIRPWRMNSADYLGAGPDGPPVGRVTPAPWDPDLAPHLLRVGRTVSEERVAPMLLDQLAEDRID